MDSRKEWGKECHRYMRQRSIQLWIHSIQAYDTVWPLCRTATIEGGSQLWVMKDEARATVTEYIDKEQAHIIELES